MDQAVTPRLIKETGNRIRRDTVAEWKWLAKKDQDLGKF